MKNFNVEITPTIKHEIESYKSLLVLDINKLDLLKTIYIDYNDIMLKLAFNYELVEWEKNLLSLNAIGYSTREIGSILNIDHCTVFVNLKRIKNSIKEPLKSYRLEDYIELIKSKQ
jgi:DNA-binding NarL/FixJ family response regulator